MKINLLIVLLLIPLAYGELIWRASGPGVDFYQFWAVSKARQIISKDLKSPYAERKKYAEYLNIHSNRSSSSALKEASRLRSSLDLTATPLLYSVFIIFPVNYDNALFLYRILQSLVFIFSVVILGITFKEENIFALISLSLLLIVVYEPISQDIWMGNLNAIQFGMLSVFAVLSLRLRKFVEDKDKLTAAIILVCGLVFFNLLKPNYFLIFIFMMFFLLKTLKTRLFLISTAAGAVFGCLMALIPCFIFNSCFIWIDWWNQIQRLRKESLNFFYAVEKGNFSTPLVLAKLLDIKTGYCTMIILLFLILSIGVILLFPYAENKKDLYERLKLRISFIFSNPIICISLGLLVTMALSPLLWMHYFVVLLLPAMWLFLDNSMSKFSKTMSLLSIVMASGIIFRLLKLHWENWYCPLPYFFASAWIPLWAGLLYIILLGNESKSSTTDAT